MNTLALVGRTTFHIEWSLKWIDACVEKVLAKPCEWNFRQIYSSGIRKGRSLAVAGVDTRPLGAMVIVIGKTGRTKIDATVIYGGEERSWQQFMTDMHSSELYLQRIEVEVTADTGESAEYTFVEHEIPGYQSCTLAAA